MAEGILLRGWYEINDCEEPPQGDARGYEVSEGWERGTLYIFFLLSEHLLTGQPHLSHQKTLKSELMFSFTFCIPDPAMGWATKQAPNKYRMDKFKNLRAHRGGSN